MHTDTETKELSLLTVQFDRPVPARHIRAFRAVISNAASGGNPHFHNHFDNPSAPPARYPLIQFKTIDRKATVVFLGSQVDSARRLFSDAYWEVELQGQRLRLYVADIDMQYHEVGFAETPQQYRIRNYLPFNQNNIRKYENEKRLSERIALLERMLRNHLLAFSWGVGWEPEGQVTARVLDTPVFRQRELRFKHIRLLGFDLEFETNLALPERIGVGGKVAVGFGALKRIKS